MSWISFVSVERCFLNPCCASWRMLCASNYDAIVFQFVEEAVVRNFVKCFLEIKKDGVCLYSIIDIVRKIVYELDKLCFC